jgi:hypothetical protein
MGAERRSARTLGLIDAGLEAASIWKEAFSAPTSGAARPFEKGPVQCYVA